jgi:hypothetical protein
LLSCGRNGTSAPGSRAAGFGSASQGVSPPFAAPLPEALLPAPLPLAPPLHVGASARSAMSGATTLPSTAGPRAALTADHGQRTTPQLIYELC